MTETMTLRARALAPLATVRHALTDPAALRSWLAEHAEVDLPHTFRFWGRTTPEGDQPRQRPLHVDDRTVRFAWLLDGEDTTVELSLAEDGPDATEISVSQSHFPGWEAAVREESGRAVLQTYWCIALANLVDHVEGRPLTPAGDFTDTGPEMRAETTIAATPAEVFHSLTDAETFSRWFGAVVDIDPRLGGHFAMGGLELEPNPATFSEFEPGRRLTIDFGDMVTTWELADSDGRTHLTIVQSGFAPDRRPNGSWLGWLSGIAELRRYHELPDWRPIWLVTDVPGLPEGILTHTAT